MTSPACPSGEEVKDLIARLWPNRKFGPQSINEIADFIEEERRCETAYRAAQQARIARLEADVTEKRRDRIGDSELAGSYLCRAEKAEARADALAKQVETYREALGSARGAIALSDLVWGTDNKSNVLDGIDAALALPAPTDEGR